MVGKYTEFEKQAGGVRIVLLTEAREDVQDIATAELDADSKLGEIIEWQLDNGWSWVRPEDIGALTDAPILSDDIEYDEHETWSTEDVNFLGNFLSPLLLLSC